MHVEEGYISGWLIAVGQRNIHEGNQSLLPRHSIQANFDYECDGRLVQHHLSFFDTKNSPSIADIHIYTWTSISTFILYSFTPFWSFLAQSWSLVLDSVMILKMCKNTNYGSSFFDNVYHKPDSLIRSNSLRLFWSR